MAYRILVVGAGAVGGYFGARLAQAGRDVTFLVRPGRADQIRRDGIRVRSPHGDLNLTPKITIAAERAEPYDLVLLSVKGFALDAALDDVAAAVGPGSVVLPVLNGMRHMDRLAERFGPGPVLGGVCMVATELDSDGQIIQLADVQKLIYGELGGELTERIERVDEAMQGAGFDAAISPDIVQAMWEKWVMLASLGAACCLLRGSVGEIVGFPGGTQVARAILDESVAVARAFGHPPSPAFMQRTVSMMTAPGSPQTSSMYRDLLGGREVEVDPIIGDLVLRADQAGVEVPLLRAAFVNLSVYSARREAERRR